MFKLHNCKFLANLKNILDFTIKPKGFCESECKDDGAYETTLYRSGDFVLRFADEFRKVLPAGK